MRRSLGACDARVPLGLTARTRLDGRGGRGDQLLELRSAAFAAEAGAEPALECAESAVEEDDPAAARLLLGNSSPSHVAPSCGAGLPATAGAPAGRMTLSNGITSSLRAL